MFSALPVPGNSWNDKNLRCLLAAFPLVGAAVGAVQVFWMLLAGYLAFPPILTAAGLTALPLLVTGGIHMDGYMDVCDALSSFGDALRKREILSDPHIGAFAAIRMAVFLVLYFGFSSALPPSRSRMLLFGLSFVVSRCLSGLAVCFFPLSKNTGLAHTFQSGADQKKTAAILLTLLSLAAALMVLGGFFLDGGRGAAAAAAMLICAAGQWLHLRRTSIGQFGGLSGDLNGWFLQKAELWMLGALALAGLL